jgi:hypothetical protein
MRVRVRAEEAERLADALAALLPAEPDLAYANFPPLAGREPALFALHARRFAAPGGLAVLVARDGADRPLACARLEPRAFDSQHFGLAMASVERPLAVADPALRHEALAALYGAAFARLAELGVAHVALRASSDDAAAGWALQQAGAFHVGTQVHFVRALDGEAAPAPPADVRLEALSAEALRGLEGPFVKRLVEWSGRAFDHGPFPFDATLPRERSLSLYQTWMERVFAGEWADGAMAARVGGEVVAVIPMKLVADLSEAAGARVFGRSLAATLPGYAGLCTALMREMIARRPFAADWMEGDTPVTTLGTINMFAKVGFRYLRATSVFHRRLERA